MRLHESKLVLEADDYAVLADASRNPRARTVYHWHEMWRRQNLGATNSPISTLKLKMAEYEEHGTNLSFNRLFIVIIKQF